MSLRNHAPGKNKTRALDAAAYLWSIVIHRLQGQQGKGGSLRVANRHRQVRYGWVASIQSSKGSAIGSVVDISLSSSNYQQGSSDRQHCRPFHLRCINLTLLAKRIIAFVVEDSSSTEVYDKEKRLCSLCFTIFDSSNTLSSKGPCDSRTQHDAVHGCTVWDSMMP